LGTYLLGEISEVRMRRRRVAVISERVQCLGACELPSPARERDAGLDPLLANCGARQRDGRGATKTFNRLGGASLL
jgi:hypothetical protein